MIYCRKIWKFSNQEWKNLKISSFTAQELRIFKSSSTQKLSHKWKFQDLWHKKLKYKSHWKNLEISRFTEQKFENFNIGKIWKMPDLTCRNLENYKSILAKFENFKMLVEKFGNSRFTAEKFGTYRFLAQKLGNFKYKRHKVGNLQFH